MPYSAQAIVPMQGAGWAVVVCHPGQGGRPALESLQAFLFGASEGAIYAPGIWHYPIIALDQRSPFFVQSWQCGTPSDCVMETFDSVRGTLTA
jgi:ureidoglycolate lyase